MAELVELDGGTMQVWIIGDDGALAERLSRYLTVELRAGLPSEPGDHAIVVVGQPVPDEAFVRASAIVLVEPALQERDRVTRMLAAQMRPRLEVVANVSAVLRAERTWALILSLAFRIPHAAGGLSSSSPSTSDLVTHNPAGGSWLDLERPVPLFGRTIGFVGFSPMGWKMAELAGQYGMRPVYWAGPLLRELQVEIEGAALLSGAVESSFDDLLATSDIIVLDVCFSDATTRLIDAAELALMRPGALLVNTAHGRAIDEGALILALRAGRLGGVVLDRFNYEPLPSDSPLRGVERALLTPGIAVPSHDEVQERVAAHIASILGPTDGPQAVTRRVRHIRRRRAMS